MSLLLARVAPAVTPVDVTDTWSVAVTDAGVVVVTGEAPQQDAVGGWFWFQYEKERERRRRRQAELEEAQEDAERIADETTREIARLLQAQEAKDAERANIDRLRRLVQQYAADARSDSARVQAALAAAQQKATRAALERLEREIERMREEEEVALLMALALVD